MDNNINENNKKSNGIQILIIVIIILLGIVIAADVILNYVPLKDIFKTQTEQVTNVTKKEVTVTDEGIADAVEKLYDATVIVKVGTNNQVTGWGSGFVYKKDDKYGYILTNHHVVADASNIQIEMTDGSVATGKLMGSDEHADVAVVRMDVNKVLAVAEIGKSTTLRVGDTVFAIGTPISLDYPFTVTRGILSGVDRLVETTSSKSGNKYSFFGQTTQTDSWYMRLLQIDASINSGNSGGPLANCNGEVIGITNSKLSSSSSLGSTASIENIGFAIPIEDALDVAELIESGKTTSTEKATLGVSMTSIDGAIANNISVSDDITYGAVVVEVQDGSNAAKAGLKKGDVIIKYNDYKIQDYRYLKYYLYKSNIGDKVTFTYIRDGKERTSDVTLG